ncbi:hypothetical protein NC652_017635 [Populus alba x Populus x berolinensis]|nr:hypothetical protein NC652_017635 [Populus alba x Populus x berolinensis]
MRISRYNRLLRFLELLVSMHEHSPNRRGNLWSIKII